MFLNAIKIKSKEKKTFTLKRSNIEETNKEYTRY